MGSRFKDREHLLRLVAVAVVGVGVFLLLRAVLVPASFGEFGFYRGAALTEIASAPMHFAGRAACEECHDDVAATRKGSLHEQIGCESCHGPLADHATDPSSVQPELPDARTLCLGCHLTNVARPAAFPQVDPKEHGDDEVCTSCHDPHHPEP